LQVPESTLRGIIDKDRELSAAYGTTGKLKPAAAPRAPTNTEVMERDEDDLPASVPGAKASSELLELVSAAEKELHLKALHALKVDETTINKLRLLDGMASSTGSMIAIGLQNTHRLYYLAVVDLKTVADQIKTRYLDDETAVNDETRPFYYRNYIDAIKEFGRAYDSFIAGAALILRIVNEGAANEGPGKTKAKLGFGGRHVKKADNAQD
jgi:hypothetical protein